jgi:hypothetical protein
MTSCQFHETHPTAAELNAVLGDRWAICRDTEKNRERYGRCITRKAYRRACAEALELRKYPNTTWSERAVWGPYWDAARASA